MSSWDVNGTACVQCLQRGWCLRIVSEILMFYKRLCVCALHPCQGIPIVWWRQSAALRERPRTGIVFSFSVSITARLTCTMHPSSAAPNPLSMRSECSIKPGSRHHLRSASCLKQPLLLYKKLKTSIHAVSLLATFHLCTVAPSFIQARETSFVATETDPRSVAKRIRTSLSVPILDAPRRFLATPYVVHEDSTRWQEAAELPADEAITLAALLDSLESPAASPIGIAPLDGSLAESERAHVNSSRASPVQSSPDSPKASRSTDPPRNQKPRYRVIGDGGDGSLYELAQELSHSRANEILDLIMNEDGIKPNTRTTTTTTPPPVLRFRQCADASARGYSMPFSCCSVQNGDFYDKRTWHCGRIPTSLDAVFIRHLVRLPASRSKLQIRALWIIKSIDINFQGKTGILRSGQFPGARCSAETTPTGDNATMVPSGEEMSTMREVFGDLLTNETPVSKASLSDLCARFRAEPFSSEEDFRIERPTAVVIKDPGTGPLGPTAAEIAFTGTTEAFGEADRDLQDEADLAIVDRHVRVESNQPGDAPVNPGGSLQAGGLSPHGEERITGRASANKSHEREAGKRHEDADDKSSPVVPFDFGRVPPGIGAIASRLPSSPRYPYFSEHARGLGAGRLPRHRNFAEPLALKGPSTLRVEPGAALLLLSGTAVVTDAPIRNDGILFIGEVLIPEEECLERRPPSQQGMCRIPSLSIGGSLIARSPIYIHWLQLSSAPRRDYEPVIWYGRVGYPPSLPGSSSSTVTFFGHVNVDKVLPGCSFSFRRLGFPPYPPPPQSPQKTALQVKVPKESVDLMIYVDVIDDDGFIDCCEEFYDREPAVFELKGVNLKLGPFSRRRKDVGDPGKISEQVILRANRITTDETFVGLPALISSTDAKMTNNEEQRKQAGTNRDVLLFQCFEECRISSQIFKAKKGYKYVQVTRDLPSGRFETTA